MTEKKTQKRAEKTEYRDPECDRLIAALMADEPTPEDRAIAFLARVEQLHSGLQRIGLNDEEQICGLIQVFFELEMMIV